MVRDPPNKHISQAPARASGTLPLRCPSSSRLSTLFLQEHRRCGELDPGVEAERVWMTCDCGAVIAHRLEPVEPDL
jgi:hypothetical protein